MAIPEVVSSSSSGTGRRRIGVPETVLLVVRRVRSRDRRRWRAVDLLRRHRRSRHPAAVRAPRPLHWRVRRTGRSLTNAGAIYAYITHGLGRVAVVGAPFIELISYSTMQIDLYGLFGFTTADLLNSETGLDLPW